MLQPTRMGSAAPAPNATAIVARAPSSQPRRWRTAMIRPLFRGVVRRHEGAVLGFGPPQGHDVLGVLELVERAGRDVLELLDDHAVLGPLAVGGEGHRS